MFVKPDAGHHHRWRGPQRGSRVGVPILEPAMNSRCRFHVIVFAVALAFVPAATHAEVRRIDITSRIDLLNGSPFGTTGPGTCSWERRVRA